MHRNIGDEHCPLSFGLDPNGHVTRVVSGRLDGRDPGSELDVARDLLEAIRERQDAPPDVRPRVLRARERERVPVDDVASPREERDAVEVRVPAHVVDVHVRQEDDVDVVACDSELVERVGQLTLALGGPVPEAGRPDAGVHEHRRPTRPEQVAPARNAPLVGLEQLRVELAIRRPRIRRNLRIRLAVGGEQPDRVGYGVELDRADAGRQRLAPMCSRWPSAARNVQSRSPHA